MRPETLSLLRCPACQGQRLELACTQADEREVRQGEIRCLDCQAIYPILQGVAELLWGLDAGTLSERNSRHKPRDWDIERQRPYLNDRPSQPWVWPAFAANVEQGLGLLPMQGKTALDIGAATCWATRMLCECGARAVAVDISTSMLLDGEAQLQTGVFFDRLAANMSALPFRDASAQVIFFSASIHHTADLRQVFAECARCLQPGGSLVLVNEPVAGWLRARASFGEADKAAGMNEHIYRLADYLQAAASAGLQAQVFFPASLRNQMSGTAPFAHTPGLRAARLAWPLLRGLAEQIITPLHRLLGVELVMLASKPEESVPVQV